MLILTNYLSKVCKRSKLCAAAKTLFVEEQKKRIKGNRLLTNVDPSSCDFLLKISCQIDISVHRLNKNITKDITHTGLINEITYASSK